MATKHRRDRTVTTPPHDHDAERAVLGACLMSPTALDTCREVINGWDFYRPAHETIWDAAVAVHESSEPVDAITVGDHLRGTGLLDQAGGPAALHDLTSSIISTASAEYHAQIVAATAVRRRLVEYATALADDAAKPEGDTDAILADAAQRLDALSRGRNRVQLKPLSETISGTLAGIEAGLPPFEPTPWPDLDDLINGWRKGGLHVIAARPGGGKSLLGLQSALTTASSGKAVTYAVMEMDHDEVNIRLLAQSANIGMGPLARRNLNDFQWMKVNKIIPDLTNAPLYVDDTPGQTVDHIRAHARAVARRHDLGLVIVDYLQQVQPAPHLSKSPRYEQVGHITRSLKMLARELNVPVLAMAQAARPAKGATPAPPNLSDLRESGDIEADADAVIFLHRPSPDDDEVEVHVRKARQGRLGDARLSWQAQYARLGHIENTYGGTA